MQRYFKLKKIKIIIFAFLISFFFIKDINRIEFSTYRVVLDPGHGGFSLVPKNKHGDRYDSISGKYLSNYLAGAKYKNIEERVITYSIANKVKNILDFTLYGQGNNFKNFKQILKKFSNVNPDRIIIQTYLSRGESLKKSEIVVDDDPNADFRLFDFVDKIKTNRLGRISIINSYKPHLVVSLHCDLQAPVYYRGINPVIAAPYSLLNNGLDYLKGNRKNKNFFFKSPYSDWFAESVKRTGFKWFLKDVSVYFTGFPVDNNCKIKSNKFMGYRYNMITWRYKDAQGWENIARNHLKNTQYAMNPEDFIPQGKFWDREKSIYESFKRDGGMEDFGGDNLYASSEIIRYILFSLYQSGVHHKSQKLGKPYISIWSMPILVNAITAYIELGYLKRKRDRFLLVNKQDEIAEGIAVGIYSLFTGLEPQKVRFKYLPKGNSINLNKYVLENGKSYFDIVVP